MKTTMVNYSSAAVVQNKQLPCTLHQCSLLTTSVGYSDDPNVRFRPSMEDALVVHEFEDIAGLFLGVYDGHGGALAASLLRQQLHCFFLDDLLAQSAEEDEDDDHHMEITDSTSSECSTPPYEDINGKGRKGTELHGVDAAKAFESAYSKMDGVLKVRRCCRTGATAVTCFVRRVGGKRVLTIANCGDSRAVLGRGGRAVRLSVDHRPVEWEEKERVEKAGGFVTNCRVNGVLNVSRAFGDHSMKSVVICTPAVKEVVLGDMDEFVVLACDGLWDFVEENEVVRIAQECFDRGLDAAKVSKELVKVAIERKSTDNVSVMVVQFDWEDQ